MGFSRAIVPKETEDVQGSAKSGGLRLVRVGTVAEAFNAALG
jgi:hypothetical protein